MHSGEEKSDVSDHHAESGPVIPKPNLEFEDGIHSIYMIIQRFPFPVVVLCDTTRCPIPVDRSKFNFDLSQPLLFYRKRSIQKIPARSLFLDDNDQYQEAGDPLLIPEDYKGYFAILKRRNAPGPSENNAPHFTKIEDIANSDTEKFLIGGQNRVKAYQVTTHKDDNQSQHEQQRMLFPGDVLRKLRIFTSETKKKTKYLRRSSLITERFLLCMDEADREVVIPFAQAGLFYALTTTSGKGTCPVMQMSDIVASKCLPCVVKLVYGRVPTTPCFFSGLLQLDHGYLEQSIVAATIMNKKNILVEIPSTCKMEFRVAHTNDELISHQGYQNAVQVCREKIHSYMRNIKVCLSWKSDDALQGAGTCSSITVGERVSTMSTEFETPEPPTPCSKDANRDSGYIKMTPSSDDLNAQSEGKFDSDNYVKMATPTSPPPDYVLKLFLENKLLEVPVYSHDASQVDDADNSFNSNTLKAADNRCQHITDPPDLPPPPVPCPGTPPSLCGGSPSQDSGISDVGLADMRRPSTFTFVENEQMVDDDITYDIPQIPIRRVSAPPNFDTMPLIQDSKRGAIHKSSPFNRRKSKSMKNRVSSAPSEMLNKDGRLISPTETIHEHDFGTESSLYENIEGLKEIQAKLIQHQNMTEAIDMADESTALRAQWYLGSTDSSEHYQTPTSQSPPQRCCDSPFSGRNDDSPPYDSHKKLDEEALKSLQNKTARLSGCSIASSDTCDNVFEASPSRCTPHDYLQLIDDKTEDKKEEEDVYDVIPEIPGSNPLPTQHELMSASECVDRINADLFEHEQPPSPHRMKPSTYVNCDDEISDTCENNSCNAYVSPKMVDCEHAVDCLSDSKIIPEPNHIPISEADSVKREESVTEHEREKKSEDNNINSIEDDKSSSICNFEGTDRFVNRSVDVVSQIREEKSIDKKNLPSPSNGGIVTVIEVKCENKNTLQEEEGCAEDINRELKCQQTDQIHSDVDCSCAPEEKQNDSSLQRLVTVEIDSLTESHDDMSIQVKLGPPPVSPKPSRTHAEKVVIVSEDENQETLVSNCDESSQSDIIDDQPVHHQLKHRERTESNSISMSPERLEKELYKVGVTKKAIEIIKDANIGIEELLNMDVDDLQKDLPGIGFLDLKKIAMLIRNVLARSSGH